jgi:hypothetical protein
MALPKLETPTYETKLIGFDEPIEFRPFLVKEEKILLMALQGGEATEADLYRAVRDVLNACVLTKDFKVGELPAYDVEYLFLQIRAKSVGEEINLNFKHRGGKNRAGEECKKVTPVAINIEDIQVKWKDKIDSKIPLTDAVGVKLRHPSVEIMAKIAEKYPDPKKQGVERIMALLQYCTDYIWDEEQMHKASEAKPEEIMGFYEALTGDQFKKIEKFFGSIPVLEYDVEYQCQGCGEKTTHKLSGIQDFFV